MSKSGAQRTQIIESPVSLCITKENRPQEGPQSIEGKPLLLGGGAHCRNLSQNFTPELKWHRGEKLNLETEDV